MLADNGGERSRNRAAPTVKKMGDALIARMRRDDLKKSHIETASGHLRKEINPLLGDMLVSEVVESDTERLVTRLTNAGLGVLGVQWELQAEWRIDARFSGVFDWFVAMAAAYAASAPARV